MTMWVVTIQDLRPGAKLTKRNRAYQAVSKDDALNQAVADLKTSNMFEGADYHIVGIT